MEERKKRRRGSTKKRKKDYKNTGLTPEFNVTQGAFQVVLPNKNIN